MSAKRIVMLKIGTLLILLTGGVVCVTNIFAYDEHGKKDPFVPLVTKEGRFVVNTPKPETTVSDIFLEGIIFDPRGASVAIINGEVLREGESFGTVSVKQITDSFVIVFINEKEYILNVFESGKQEEGKLDEK